MEIKELEAKFKAAGQDYKAKKGELFALLIRVGTLKAIEKFLISPEFEEEACLYCGEMGWEAPK